LINKTFWKDKSVLITGHSGFKGSWLTIWLESLGAKVCGVSLEPTQKDCLFNYSSINKLCKSYICDIRELEKLKNIIVDFNPHIIFHLAAQPLVKEGYKDPVNTYSTNVMGTVNIIQIARYLPRLQSLVVITTDKVYKNKEWKYPYRENDELGGYDPYSSSKAATEIAVSSFRDSFFKNKSLSITTARAGNVIGGGDWSPDRLIPDAIRAWRSSQKLIIRHPSFIRPWQHVLEPLYGYLLLAQCSYGEPSFNGAYNFGPKTDELITVKRLLEIACEFELKLEIDYIEQLSFHESSNLVLENSLSMDALGYKPRWEIRKSLKKTIDWYKDFYSDKNSLKLCIEDINDFLN
tara:strand:+ start:4224 stop:5270 length:1047 start_codon:yes stop_codon:yes gene_type:complete